MKKLVLFVCILNLSFVLARGNGISINGVVQTVDTLLHQYTIGPGTKYASYRLPDFPLSFHVMEVDLSNPYVEIETCLGQDKAVATETPVSMAARKNYPGHDVVGATNGDFYFYQDPPEIGIPRSGQFLYNECITNPVGRASFVLSPERVPYIDRVDFNGVLTKGNLETRIHTVNMQRLEWEPAVNNDLLTLYTPAYGTETSAIQGGYKVVIRPVGNEPFFFSANKDIPCLIEEIYENTGAIPIPDGRAVLHGRGTSADFLGNLSVGDELNIRLRVNLRSAPGLLTDLSQQVGGSNHIILRDGGRLEGDESANPRTGIGISQDRNTVYLVVVDGRGASKGLTLYEFGELFKGIGAWNAVNLDGGGSSVMVIEQEVVNNPSDGPVRAVGNGVLVVSTAPPDDEVGLLEFEPGSVFKLPVYGKLRPRLRGLNQYGVLKDNDIKDYTLSCSEEIGYISEDGYFIASDKAGKGTLTATYNGLSVSREVIVHEAELYFALDSVLVGTYPYPIQVRGKVNGEEVEIDNSIFSWEIEDPLVCKVEDGMLKPGEIDGSTKLRGTLGDLELSMKVKVETPKSDKPIGFDKFSDIMSWEIKSSSTIKNTGFGWAEEPGIPFRMNYSYSIGRLPYIQLLTKATLYSTPDSVKVVFDSGSAEISSIFLTFRTNTDKVTQTIRYEETDANVGPEITFNIQEYISKLSNPYAAYPINFEGLKFNFNPSSLANGQEGAIYINELSAYYNKDYFSGTDDLTLDPRICFYPNPVKDGYVILALPGEQLKDVRVSLFSLEGIKLKECIYWEKSDGEILVPLEKIVPGMYLLSVIYGDRQETVKIVIE